MRPVEFYVAIAASALFVYESNKEKAFWSRFVITIASAGFGFSVSPEVSEYLGRSLTLTGVLITALGFLALEVTSSIIADTSFVKGIIARRLGAKE